MKYPDVNPIFNHAKKEHVRKQLELVYGSRCKMNIALLEEALKLRREKAQLLGYNTHADFIIDVRMAKKTSAALEFLVFLKYSSLERFTR